MPIQQHLCLINCEISHMSCRPAHGSSSGSHTLVFSLGKYKEGTRRLLEARTAGPSYYGEDNPRVVQNTCRNVCFECGILTVGSGGEALKGNHYTVMEA